MSSWLTSLLRKEEPAGCACQQCAPRVWLGSVEPEMSEGTEKGERGGRAKLQCSDAAGRCVWVPLKRYCCPRLGVCCAGVAVGAGLGKAVSIIKGGPQKMQAS